jgi:gamma-glutamylcyclotransferase (GGCT)/AIG2-like uncharacterized protein YtfP
VTDALFVYGTLAPGAPNEHVLAGLEGRWVEASVRGHLGNAGWASDGGYPGLVLDANAAPVAGLVLFAAGLEGRWAELDAFEGIDYARVVAEVQLADGTSTEAFVYVLRPTP